MVARMGWFCGCKREWKHSTARSMQRGLQTNETTDEKVDDLNQRKADNEDDQFLSR